jgi:HNH endonuclease
VLVDIQARLRGEAEPGETCEIPGVGPLPVSRLYDLAPEAIWHLLVTNGQDIRAYCSATRHIPIMLRVALAARDRECVVPGCNQTHGLEIDHIHPFSQHGPTTYENLAVLSPHHHRLKTLEGWTLTHQQGQWHFDPPDKTGTGPP